MQDLQKACGLQTSEWPPFSYRDKEQQEEEDDVTQETYTAIAKSCPGGDKPKSLKQAKESPEWEEWKHAVKSEMD